MFMKTNKRFYVYLYTFSKFLKFISIFCKANTKYMYQSIDEAKSICKMIGELCLYLIRISRNNKVAKT
jgi:hypothetical protein